MAASTERRTLYLPQDFKAAHRNDQKTRARWVKGILHPLQFDEQKGLKCIPCNTCGVREIRTDTASLNNGQTSREWRTAGRPSRRIRNTQSTLDVSMLRRLIQVPAISRSPFFYRYLISNRLFRNPKTRSCLKFSHGTIFQLLEIRQSQSP